MVKKSILLIIVCLIISGSSTASKKDVNNTNINYTVVKKKINLLPIDTYSILGLNSYLYKDSKGLEYLIYIIPKIKEYSWLVDTIKLEKKILKDKNNTNLPEPPINLYLNETIELKFTVKLLSKNVKNNYSVNLILPYYIFLNNKKTNKIFLLKDKEINLTLEDGKTFIISEKLKISFPEEDLNNLEILVSFRQNAKEFNNLKTYTHDKNMNFIIE